MAQILGISSRARITMVGIAQLVRAPDCDSGGRRFESGYSPLKKPAQIEQAFFVSSHLTIISRLSDRPFYNGNVIVFLAFAAS